MNFSVDRGRRKWATGLTHCGQRTLPRGEAPVRHLLGVAVLLLPMVWAMSAEGRAAVPLPKPRPAQAPGVQDSRPEDAEKNNLPQGSRPEAEPEQAADPKSNATAAKPAASPCRLALTETIAIAPSIPPIRGPGACGAEDLVRLEAVVLAGGQRVPLKPAAILRCTMASAIADWARTDMAALAGKLGSALSEIDNFDSFECRGRNRIKGAQLSEHGKANALDVRGFKLASGKFISLTDRNESREVREQVLHSVCARFSTVLGPGSDWYHEDHIHLDLAERRSNYRICQWNVYDPLPQVAPLLPAVRPDEAPPREVAEGQAEGGHPPAAAAPPPQPAAQPEPQAAEPEGAEPEAAAPVVVPKATKSRRDQSRGARAKATKTGAAQPTQPKTEQPEAAQPEAAQPEPAPPDAAPTPASPETPAADAATPETTKPAAPPPAQKKKRKPRRAPQPNFFGLPLPKFPR